MKVLITGITGFVGSHLTEYLLSKEYEVCGAVRRRSRTEYIDGIKDELNLIECDITDQNSVEPTLKEASPDIIFHLAAQSFVPTSWRAPLETFDVNVKGTVNLFEAVRKSDFDPVVHVAGSSEEYGMIYPDEIPIKEENPLRPLSPYGVSKVAADLLAYQYHKSYGIKSIRTRAFNHTGPRRGEMFVTSNFAKQIVEIEKGLKEPVIYVGNLKAKRDFTDVRDTVRAYHLAVEKCDYGEVYNICSGNALKIREVLNTLLGLTDLSITIKQDPNRMRPSDVEILEGDYSKFNKKTGWTPTIPFEKTMEDLLTYWRDTL